MIRTRIEVEKSKKSEVDGAEVGRLERAGDAGEAGAEGEREELRPDRVDAHHLGGRLVLADGAPGAAHARALEVAGDDDGDEQQGHAEVDRGWPERAPKMMPRNGRYGGSIGLMPCDAAGQFAFWSTMMIGPEVERERDARQVLEEERHDLAEAEGHDRQVVAAQPQGRGAEQGAERRDDDDRRRSAMIQNGRWMPGGSRADVAEEGQVDAERAEMRRGEERRRVRADGVERDIAEVEQTRRSPATMFSPMAMIAKIVMNVDDRVVRERQRE